jgi:multidrug efflux pump
MEAARVRLRPILMTSACFVHMVPPYFATGAGAEMRRSLGTAVLWGAFGVTLFGIFLTPVFFYVVRWFSPSVRFDAIQVPRAAQEKLLADGGG